MLAGEKEHGERRADEAAMEGHAAVPHLDGPHRIGRDGSEIVEQDVTEAAAGYDADRGPEDEVVDLLQGGGRLAIRPQMRPLQEVTGDHPAEKNAGDIGQPIPVDRQRTDRKGDRIDRGKGYGGEKVQN